MKRVMKEAMGDCSTTGEFRFLVRCQECGRTWIFSRCPVCGRLVCDRCFLICEDLDLCIACAKTLQVRGNVVAEEASFPQELPAEPAETIATEGDGST